MVRNAHRSDTHGITEQLNTEKPLEWVQRINNNWSVQWKVWIQKSFMHRQ